MVPEINDEPKKLIRPLDLLDPFNSPHPDINLVEHIETYDRF